METIMSITLAIVLLLAFLLYLMPMIAGLCIDRRDRRKRGESLDDGPAQYDERQRLIRLEASQHALYALGGYLLLWLVLEFFSVLPWENRTVPLLTLGVFLALVIWSGECILRGAMLGFNQRRNEAGQIIMHFSLGTCWTAIGWLNLDAMSGSLAAVQLSMGVCFLILGGLMLWARHRRKRAERLDAGDGAG